MTAQGLTHGNVVEFTMSSADSKYYPGIAREKGTFGTPDPDDPAKLVITTSHPAPYTRNVAVYVPKDYVPGTEAPFIVGADGPDRLLFAALDGLIPEHKLPAMMAISIGNGSGDAQGSERGLEYDTMSGRMRSLSRTRYCRRLRVGECEADPRSRWAGDDGRQLGRILRSDMAWYHPEWYHRVLTYSGTYVNQQWP